MEQVYFLLLDTSYNSAPQAYSLRGYRQTKEHVFKNSKPYLFISPEGKIVEGKNLWDLCRREGLQQSAMHDVLVGNLNQYKKWTANFNNHLIVKLWGNFTAFNKNNGQPSKVKRLSDGKVFKVFNQTKFRKKHNLQSSELSLLLRGKVKRHKDFILAQ